MSIEVVPITAIKRNTKSVFDKVKGGDKVFFIARHSQAEAVILSFNYYQDLISRLEDLEDALEFKKARENYREEKPIDYEEYRKKRFSRNKKGI